MAGSSGSRRGKGRGGRGKQSKGPELRKKRKLSESSASSKGPSEKSAKRTEKDTLTRVEEPKDTDNSVESVSETASTTQPTGVPLVKQAIIQRNEAYNKIIKDVQNLVGENKGLHEKIEDLQNMIRHKDAEIKMLKSTIKEGVCTKCTAQSPESQTGNRRSRKRHSSASFRDTPNKRNSSPADAAETEEPSSTTGVNPIPFAEPFHDHELFQRHSQEQGRPVVPVSVHEIRQHTVRNNVVHNIDDDDDDDGAATPPEKRHQIISITANKDDEVVVLDDDEEEESENLQKKIKDIAKMDRQRLGLL